MCFHLVFLSSTYESLGLRDNESRLYILVVVSAERSKAIRSFVAVLLLFFILFSFFFLGGGGGGGRGGGYVDFLKSLLVCDTKSDSAL